ncbi:MbtH family NRPS accessory protein [Streptomyces nigrescens]
MNDLAEHSLWPTELAVPAGWRVLRTGLGRQAAMEAVDQCAQSPRTGAAIAGPGVELVAEIARRATERPDAAAVLTRSGAGAESALTYRDLDEQAE